MTDTIHNTILPMTDTTAEPEDYTGEDGLLYCGKCRKPKEAYFPEGKTFFGRDRHPSECDCQRAARKEREAAEKRRSHLETVERLKRQGFTDKTMQDWTFANDNGSCPQMKNAAHARIYDRLLEMCSPLCFTGENLRKAAAQGKMEQLKRLLAGKEICL